MISRKMQSYVAGSSAIRAMFEEGRRMAAVYGPDKVYDFSLGNPNVPAPDAVREAIVGIVTQEDPVLVHGYMNNSGYEDVRERLAGELNRRYGTDYRAEHLMMTVGAAGGLNVILKTILDPGDEVITVTPYFGEYRSYVSNYDGVLVEAAADPVTFFPDPEDLGRKLNPRTKALILNSPNNPTGVVYPEPVLRAVAERLEAAERAFGHPIYLISDEPYSEIVYDGAQVPWLPLLYRDTIVGTSYSKSLSLPGERIGYLVIPPDLADAEEVTAAANVAGRILGFVNAPSLMQRVVARCCGEKADVAFYDRNRKLLCDALAADGFTFVKPEGAFYLWIQSPTADERTFVKDAKEEERILLVQGRSFGCSGWVRLAYCVSHETVQNALPGFERLAKKYELSR